MRRICLPLVLAALWLSETAPVTAQTLDCIWITNSAQNSVTRIRRDGTVLATYTVPPGRPVGLSVRDNGDMWVAIQSLAQVYAIDASGKAIGTFAASGRPTNTGVDLQGNIWCGNLTSSFLKYSPSGKLLASLNLGGSASQGMCCDSTGDIFLADGTAGKIWKIAPNGQLLATLVQAKHRFAVVDHRDDVFTSGFGSTDLCKWTNSGSLVGTYPIGVTTPQGMAVDRDGNVWIGTQTTTVLKYSGSGRPLGSFATGGSWPLAVAVDGMGDLWVSNYSSASVTKMQTDGTVLMTIPVGTNPIPVGDGSGFQRAVFTDPFGDVDGDGHLNNAEAVAGTNVFDGGSVPCTLAPGGDQKVGGTATLNYVDFGARAAGATYVMACSFTPGNFPIDRKRRIDLSPDALFFASLQVPALFRDFVGVLDTNGRATGTIHIPKAAALASNVVYGVAVTLDPTAPMGIRSIAPVARFTIKA
jgi:hypothetical protein